MTISVSSPWKPVLLPWATGKLYAKKASAPETSWQESSPAWTRPAVDQASVGRMSRSSAAEPATPPHTPSATFGWLVGKRWIGAMREKLTSVVPKPWRTTHRFGLITSLPAGSARSSSPSAAATMDPPAIIDEPPPTASERRSWLAAFARGAAADSCRAAASRLHHVRRLAILRAGGSWPLRSPPETAAKTPRRRPHPIAAAQSNRLESTILPFKIYWIYWI